MVKTTKTAKPAAKPAAKAAAKPAAKSNGNGSPAKAAAPAAASAPLTAPEPVQGTQPTFKILGQYLKDFSFENPNAPASLAPQQNQPDINIAVNVNARNLGPSEFEVELHLNAKATGGGHVVFAAELLYAGIFRLENFPKNVLQAAVLIECPRMLFPFARQIMADATRNGGFPPLMLDPIDFAQMYQQRMKQQAAASA
jgi:preprotein translocase subunit SecB